MPPPGFFDSLMDPPPKADPGQQQSGGMFSSLVAPSKDARNNLAAASADYARREAMGQRQSLSDADWQSLQSAADKEADQEDELTGRKQTDAQHRAANPVGPTPAGTPQIGTSNFQPTASERWITNSVPGAIGRGVAAGATKIAAAADYVGNKIPIPDTIDPGHPGLSFHPLVSDQKLQDVYDQSKDAQAAADAGKQYHVGDALAGVSPQMRGAGPSVTGLSQDLTGALPYVIPGVSEVAAPVIAAGEAGNTVLDTTGHGILAQGDQGKAGAVALASGAGAAVAPSAGRAAASGVENGLFSDLIHSATAAGGYTAPEALATGAVAGGDQNLQDVARQEIQDVPGGIAKLTALGAVPAAGKVLRGDGESMAETRSDRSQVQQGTADAIAANERSIKSQINPPGLFKDLIPGDARVQEKGKGSPQVNEGPASDQGGQGRQQIQDDAGQGQQTGRERQADEAQGRTGPVAPQAQEQKGSDGVPVQEITPEAKATADALGVTIDRSRDVPLAGGISQDGGTVSIDKNMPQTKIMPDGKVADVDASLVTHEVAEKPAIDANTAKGVEAVKAYEDAHNGTAVPAEDKVLKAKGIEPDEFNVAIKPDIEAIADRNREAVKNGEAQNLPPNLQAEHVAAGAKEGLNPQKAGTGTPRAHDILDDMKALGGVNLRKGESQGGDYDDVPTMPLAHRSAVKGKLAPDQMAKALHDQGIGDGTVNTMWDLLGKASADRTNPKLKESQPGPTPEEKRADQESQGIVPDSDLQKPGDEPLAPGDRVTEHPELANPGRTPAQRDAWVQQHNNRDIKVRSDEEVEAEADRRLAVSPENEYGNIMDLDEQGRPLNDVETVIAKKLADRLYEDPKTYERANALMKAYERSGTAAGRGMRQRIDDLQSPTERGVRARVSAANAVVTPPRPDLDAKIKEQEAEISRQRDALDEAKRKLASKRAATAGASVRAKSTLGMRANARVRSEVKALAERWKELNQPGRLNDVTALPAFAVEAVARLVKVGVLTFADAVLAITDQFRNMRYNQEAHKALEKAWDDLAAKDKTMENREGRTAKDVVSSDPRYTAEKRLNEATTRLNGLATYYEKLASDLEAMSPDKRAEYLENEAKRKAPTKEIAEALAGLRERLRSVREQITALSEEALPAEKQKLEDVLRVEQERLDKMVAGWKAERDRLAKLTPDERLAEAISRKPINDILRMREETMAANKSIRDELSALRNPPEPPEHTAEPPERLLEKERERLANVDKRLSAEQARLKALSPNERLQEAQEKHRKSDELRELRAEHTAKIKDLASEVRKLKNPDRAYSKPIGPRSKEQIEVERHQARLDHLQAKLDKHYALDEKRKALDKEFFKKEGFDLDDMKAKGWQDPADFARFQALLESRRVGWSYAVANALIIGPIHASLQVISKKVTSDILSAATEGVKANVSPLIGSALELAGLGIKDAPRIGEVRHYWAAMGPAWRDASSDAWTVAKGGSSRNEYYGDHLRVSPLIAKTMPGSAGRMTAHSVGYASLLTPVRIVHSLMFTSTARLKVASHAYRTAVDADGKRLEGEVLENHMRQEVSNPKSVSWQRALLDAQRATFTEPLPAPLQKLAAYKATPGQTRLEGAAKLALSSQIPFVGIPANRYKQALLNWTPIVGDIATVMRFAIDKDKEGNKYLPMRDIPDQVVQAGMRWLLGYGVLNLVGTMGANNQPTMTGHVLDAKGNTDHNLSYTVEIGGHRRNYLELGAVGPGLGLFADYWHGVQKGKVPAEVLAGIAALSSEHQDPLTAPITNVFREWQMQPSSRDMYERLQSMVATQLGSTVGELVPSFTRQIGNAARETVPDYGIKRPTIVNPETGKDIADPAVNFWDEVKHGFQASALPYTLPDKLVDGQKAKAPTQRSEGQEAIAGRPEYKDKLNSPVLTLLDRLFDPIKLGVAPGQGPTPKPPKRPGYVPQQ